ncbi:MAG TPA: NUDIX hydrolase [Aeromicrobium sp.]|nr:NUDIX hydrolase [Aeromicrobium sp.]
MSGSRLADGDVELEPTSGAEDLDGWSILIGGERRGTIALRRESRTTVSVRWNTGRDFALSQRALTLILRHAFGDLGYRRIEARVPVDDLADIRAASLSGLRREGILRGHGDEPDRVMLARLVDDPPADSKEGFIALLNSGLPTKRVIAQGLLRDEAGRVLLCRLTYKPEWDLPGGVIEVGESPAVGLVRELEEELGVTVTVRSLITVNWLPAWRGWDDACILLFDLGVAESSITDRMELQPTEIAGVEWCDVAAVAEHATAATRELLAALDDGAIQPYRESSGAT